MKLLKFCIFIMLLHYIQLISETRYVSKTAGLNSAPPYTSWATACDSLQKCFDYCNSGDTVYVDRGIYRETIYVHDKDLTIIGVDTDECILDGTGLNGKVNRYTMCWFKKTNVTLNNLTLKFKRVDDFDYYYAAIFEEGFTNIYNCIIDSTGTGLGLLYTSNVRNTIIRNADWAIKIGASFDPEFEIENNYFYILSLRSYPCGINAGMGGGSFKITNNIMIKDSEQRKYYGVNIFTNKKVEIKNNLFCRFNIAIAVATYHNAVNDTTLIYNNTITNCTATGIVFGNAPTVCEIRNNIIAHCAIHGITSNTDPVKVDYNTFYDIGSTIYNNITPGEHDILANPMFNNDTIATLNGSYDYRLQKYSPAIDSGDPNILDVDGTRSDMGVYGGPLGITYNYQDLPPKRITGLAGEYDDFENIVKLHWNSCESADVKYYNIYKDVNPNFTIDSTKIIAVTTKPMFNDSLNKGTLKVYYKVTAVDSIGYESSPSTEISVTITENEEVEITENYTYELYQNYPNPFNPCTTISYSLKDPGEVRVKLYTITGELIKTIIEGIKNKGYNETKIDLSTYSSGIYLYRLEVTGAGKLPVFNDLKKMVFVK